MIMKLETVDAKGQKYPKPAYTYVSAEHIVSFDPYPFGDGCTQIELSTGRCRAVALSPDDLAAAIDPEGACPEPGRCGYQEYLAYRKEGERDLAHGAYHAAVRLAEQHAQSCRVYESGRICPACQRNEQRIRA